MSFEWIIVNIKQLANVPAWGRYNTAYIDNMKPFWILYLTYCRCYTYYSMPKRGVKRFLLKFANAILSVYIELFRGTPMIVQAMVIYYGTALAFGVDMNRLSAAIFIVSVNTGAYTSEIVRGGIVSIDKGQFEAAHAIGMNHIQTMINVILPQTIRNDFTGYSNNRLLTAKDTSVLNVISVTELYLQTKLLQETISGILSPSLLHVFSILL